MGSTISSVKGVLPSRMAFSVSMNSSYSSFFFSTAESPMNSGFPSFIPSMICVSRPSTVV